MSPDGGTGTSTKKPPSGTPVSRIVILSPALMTSRAVCPSANGAAGLIFCEPPPQPVSAMHTRRAPTRISLFMNLKFVAIKISLPGGGGDGFSVCLGDVFAFLRPLGLLLIIISVAAVVVVRVVALDCDAVKHHANAIAMHFFNGALGPQGNFARIP